MASRSASVDSRFSNQQRFRPWMVIDVPLKFPDTYPVLDGHRVVVAVEQVGIDRVGHEALYRMGLSISKPSKVQSTMPMKVCETLA